MRTYLLGPFLTLLPRRWRQAMPAFLWVDWQRAAIVSSVAEFLAAIVGLAEWYFHGLGRWVDTSVSNAVDGKAMVGITTNDIAGVTYFVWITHPLTWFIGYFILEGVVRFVAAAVTDNIYGTLPLYIADKFVGNILWPAPAKSLDLGGPVPSGGVSSQTRPFRDSFLTAMTPKASDELRFKQREEGEILEIHASRMKQDWAPPRVVRYADSYYRLERFSREVGSRPFVYHLRKLAAGVPGRNVLLYQPEEVLVREKS